jgi:hypothetical protein
MSLCAGEDLVPESAHQVEEAGQYKQRGGGRAQEPEQSKVREPDEARLEADLQGHGGQLGLEQLAAGERRELGAGQQQQQERRDPRVPGTAEARQAAAADARGARPEDRLPGPRRRQGTVTNTRRQGAAGRRPRGKPSRTFLTYFLPSLVSVRFNWSTVPLSARPPAPLPRQRRATFADSLLNCDFLGD